MVMWRASELVIICSCVVAGKVWLLDPDCMVDCRCGSLLCFGGRGRVFCIFGHIQTEDCRFGSVLCFGELKTESTINE